LIRHDRVQPTGEKLTLILFFLPLKSGFRLDVFEVHLRQPFHAGNLSRGFGKALDVLTDGFQHEHLFWFQPLNGRLNGLKALGNLLKPGVEPSPLFGGRWLANTAATSG
jgi:hypothetical protein